MPMKTIHDGVLSLGEDILVCRKKHYGESTGKITERTGKEEKRCHLFAAISTHSLIHF